jgi:glycerol-3-phosphate acyltransferase PlsY
MGKDILRHGSGKTGTANILSLLGRGPAALVFALDLLKGLAVVLAARSLPWPSDAWLGLSVGAAGAAAIAGHNWSLWVRLFAGAWGGGRGIMVAVGTMLAVQPLVVAAAALVGLGLFVWRRDVLLATLAAIAAGLVAAVVLLFMEWLSPWLLAAALVWGALVALGFSDAIFRRPQRTSTGG